MTSPLFDLLLVSMQQWEVETPSLSFIHAWLLTGPFLYRLNAYRPSTDAKFVIAMDVSCTEHAISKPVF